MKKSRVTLLVAILIAMSFTLSCSSNESNEEKQEPSSSSVAETPSSSSEEQSSSSSIEQSSSSLAMPSSSSVEQSSSSVATPSSSSVEQSSSSVATSSSSSEDLCAGFVEGEEREHNGKQKKQICDPRDGQRYVYVKIGERDWFAENLNYNANDSRCYGDNTGGDSQNNCAKYGRLYDWDSAKTACPSGWHLPSNPDWEALITAVGGEATAGKHLKAQTGWSSNGNGSDTYGFSALPGGYGDADGYSVDIVFGNVDVIGYWWSSSKDNKGRAYYRNIGSNGIEITGWYYDANSSLFSVRCVKDN